MTVGKAFVNRQYETDTGSVSGRQPVLRVSVPGESARYVQTPDLDLLLPGQVVACRGESRPGHGLVPGVRLAEWAVVILGLAHLSTLTASTRMSASTGTSAARRCHGYAELASATL